MIDTWARRFGQYIRYRFIAACIGDLYAIFCFFCRSPIRQRPHSQITAIHIVIVRESLKYAVGYVDRIAADTADTRKALIWISNEISTDFTTIYSLVKIGILQRNFVAFRIAAIISVRTIPAYDVMVYSQYIGSIFRLNSRDAHAIIVRIAQ